MKDGEGDCYSEQKDVHKLLFAHLEPYRRSLQGEGIPEAVGHVVDRMVKLDRNERYQSLREMVEAFNGAIGGEKRRVWGAV